MKYIIFLNGKGALIPVLFPETTRFTDMLNNHLGIPSSCGFCDFDGYGILRVDKKKQSEELELGPGKYDEVYLNAVVITDVKTLRRTVSHVHSLIQRIKNGIIKGKFRARIDLIKEKFEG